MKDCEYKEVVKEQVSELKEDIDKINYILNGNGRTGLKTKVMIIWRTYLWLIALASGTIGWLVRGAVT